MGNYRLEGETYIIENYDKLPAFSSFLPGLAGVKGIPLWVFYTNRGQGINSFGIHHKSNAIMEFNPANTAYENTALKGFRTFLKINKEYYEPFFPSETKAKRVLYVKANSFAIEEVNEEKGIKIRVNYYVLPEENIGALVRKVEITNISGKDLDIEVLDGMPKIIPYGVANGAFKEMSNLLKSWTEIKNIENQVPYITQRGSSDDSAEVQEIEGGYFYLSAANNEILPIIYDVDLVFGYDTSLVNPVEFMNRSVKELKEAEQCFYNKVPSGFTAGEAHLAKEATYTFTSYVGFSNSVEEINEKVDALKKAEYIAQKEKESDRLVSDYTNDVKTKTALPDFDKYVEQCYLDNFLRGGYPFVFNKDSNPSVVHLFSRKHGDPERDYNFFAIAGEYYSQGNGNFRDVNQNRRNDVFFNPLVGTFNIKTFFSLIQIDGYNPLEVRPSTFTIKNSKKDEVNAYFDTALKNGKENIQKVVGKSFTPGQIAKAISTYHVELNVTLDELLETVLLNSDQHIEAGFGEGYWSDHWGYNMDLVDDYLKVFPDKSAGLLYEDNTYGYYDSAAKVLKRSETYVLRKKGAGQDVRQYGSMVHDDEKSNRAGFVKNGANWLADKDGNKIETNLMTKLISLGLIKFATLDPYGMGVEMEAGKPGWNDAMNGLPGIFGSGMAETFELKRVVEFIGKHIDRNVEVPTEIADLLETVYGNLNKLNKNEITEFEYWNLVAGAREDFRDKVRFSLSGDVKELSAEAVKEIFAAYEAKIEAGIKRAAEYDNVMPTYFTFEAVKYHVVKDEEGNDVISGYGLPKVVVEEFKAVPLPAFLEGPARMLKVLDNAEKAKEVCVAVKASELFDEKLKMYKTSVPLDEISMENGRIRAFTPGWLERESIFLHMEYKYLYGMLKADVCDMFYEEIKNTFIPFLPPEEYGRSILENSSFIASSRNPNKEVHKRGYVARLSGSTTELISMWISMFMGEKVFTYEDGELKLNFEPKLADYFFDEKGEVSFHLFSKCMVTYKNEKKLSTYGKDGVKATSIYIPEKDVRIEGSAVTGELAAQIREGKISKIVVELN